MTAPAALPNSGEYVRVCTRRSSSACTARWATSVLPSCRLVEAGVVGSVPTFRLGKSTGPFWGETGVTSGPGDDCLPGRAAPGTTADDWSRTVPTIDPVSSCADAGTDAVRMKTSEARSG